MKKISFFKIILLICLCFVNYLAAGEQNKNSNQKHEVFIYDIRWLGFHIGEAKLIIKEAGQDTGGQIRVLELSVETNKFLSKIYPVKDKYTSHVDIANRCSLKHEVTRREGRYEKDAVTIFDQNNHVGYFKNFSDGSQKEFAIPSYAQDPLSALYFFLGSNIKLGDNIFYEVVNNEKIYKVFASIEKELFINYKGKKFLVYKIDPYAIIDDRKVRGGHLVCFVAKDTNLPVRVMLKGPIFTNIELMQKDIL